MHVPKKCPVCNSKNIDSNHYGWKCKSCGNEHLYGDKFPLSFRTFNTMMDSE